MTSNIGSQVMRERAAFEQQTMGQMVEEMQDMTPEAAAKKLMEFSNRINDALRSTFKPEFLNRIDDIVTFDELTIADMEPIVDLQLEDIRKRLAGRRITLDVTPEAMEHLSIDGYDPVYGARPLKRLIQREIVDRIAQQVIEGKVFDRSHVLIGIGEDGNYRCTVEEPLDVSSLEDLDLTDLDAMGLDA